LALWKEELRRFGLEIGIKILHSYFHHCLSL